MIAAIYVLYVLTCLFLILVVLLQAGKGDGMGAVFGGGGSNTLLGNRGAATFLSKLTVASAVLFMLLSIVLAYHSSTPGSRVGGGRVDPGDMPGLGGVELPIENDDDEGVASDDEAPASDDEAPASDDEAPASDDEAPASDDEAPASDDETAPADEVAPTDDEAASADEAAPEAPEGEGHSEGTGTQ